MDNHDKETYERHSQQVRTLMRQLLRENTDLTVDDLVNHPEVAYACEGLKYQICEIQTMGRPSKDIQEAAQRFIRYQGWTLEETACLLVNANPEEFLSGSGDFNTFWRCDQGDVLEELRRAVIMGTLFSKSTPDGTIWLQPKEVIRWSHENNLLRQESAEAFQSLLTTEKEPSYPCMSSPPPSHSGEELQKKYDKTTRLERCDEWCQHAVELKTEYSDWNQTQIAKRIEKECNGKWKFTYIRNAIRNHATDEQKQILNMTLKEN